jgi:glyoxylase-like metal-dependent hydrolase (beta-lactamase superfamily II)
MKRLAAGISYLDLNFLGSERIIASAVLHTAGAAIIDPGPSTTLETLRRELGAAGLSFADVDAILLTHIHLDHGGATGTILAENPRIRVFVHEKGAAHLVSPDKLIASATRLYGDDMHRLWGEIKPVPAAAIVALQGGETIEAGGRTLHVAYTPGHASHHVSFLNADSGIAFVGDTAGVRLVPHGSLLPPTPPPDIDIAQWRDSIARIGAWGADTLFITHFGPQDDSRSHLSELVDRLDFVVDLATRSLAVNGSDEAREAWFAEELRRDLRRRMPADPGREAEDVRAYERAGRFDLNWKGLARYLRKGLGHRG